MRLAASFIIYFMCISSKSMFKTQFLSSKLLYASKPIICQFLVMSLQIVTYPTEGSSSTGRRCFPLTTFRSRHLRIHWTRTLRARKLNRWIEMSCPSSRCFQTHLPSATEIKVVWESVWIVVRERSNFQVLCNAWREEWYLILLERRVGHFCIA